MEVDGLNTTAMVITIIVILLGIAGTIVPFIPGVPLIFIAITTYGWYEGFHIITAKYIAVMATLTILSIFVDYLASTLGAKYFGSSKYGIYGALIGTVLGIFIFPPAGLLIGPWIGAIVGEMIAGKDLSNAFRTGIGTILGLFSGVAFSLILAIIMLISFLIIVF